MHHLFEHVRRRPHANYFEPQIMQIEWLMNYRCRLDKPARWVRETQYGLLVSAFNDSDRVQGVFEELPAREKLWVFQSEYSYTPAERARAAGRRSFVVCKTIDESEVANEVSDAILSNLRTGERLCIDITGFMRCHVISLVATLRRKGITSFDAVYSEPDRYKDREDTQFSKGDVVEVRQVIGYEGDHVSGKNELLIVGAGFDHGLVAQVLNYKSSAYQVMLYGLPSLAPEMYQQSVLRMSLVGDSTAAKRAFCSASDPFVTAHVLSDLVTECSMETSVENIYISPLSTKPQALGFALYCLSRTPSIPTSILFPFSSGYARDTGVGRSRSWLYRIEM